jgi:hypothetical protein
MPSQVAMVAVGVDQKGIEAVLAGQFEQAAAASLAIAPCPIESPGKFPFFV